MATEKTLKVKIVTQLEGESSFKKLGESLDRNNVKVTQFNTTIRKNKDGLDEYVHNIELTAKALEHLKIAQVQAAAALEAKNKVGFKLAFENPLKDVQQSYDLVEKALQDANRRRAKIAQDSEKELDAIRERSYKRQLQSVQDHAINLAAAEEEANKQRIAAKRKDVIAAFEEQDRLTKAFYENQTALEEHKTRVTKEFLTQAEFAAKASYNSRYNMYSEMFDKIEAKEKALANLPKEAAAKAVSPIRNLERTRLDGTFNYGTGKSTIASPIIPTKENEEALRRHNQLLAESAKGHKNLFTHVGEVIGAYQVWNTTLNLTKQALLSIPKAGMALEGVKATFLATFGSEEGEKNLEFLEKLAMSAGQNISVLRDRYKSFAPAAVLAGVAQKDVNKIFQDFVETATVLQLPEEKLQSLFLALEQMFGKGVVQSEEIKKQLGNVLPAAVEIGAKAAKMSVSDFMEAMKKNAVVAKQFALDFAATYRTIFGGGDDSAFILASQKLKAQVERVKTQYTLLTEDIYERSASVMSQVVKGVANVLEVLRNNLQTVTDVIEIALIGIVTRYFAVLATKTAQQIALNITLIGTYATLGRAANVGYGATVADAATTSFGKLKVVLAGVGELFKRSVLPILTKTGWLTLAAGITYAVGKLSGFGVELDKQGGLLLTFKDRQLAVSKAIETIWAMTRDKLAQIWADTIKAFETPSLGGVLLADLKAFTPAVLGYVQVLGRNIVAEWNFVKESIANPFTKIEPPKLFEGVIEESAKAGKQISKDFDAAIVKMMDTLGATDKFGATASGRLASPLAKYNLPTGVPDPGLSGETSDPKPKDGKAAAKAAEEAAKARIDVLKTYLNELKELSDTEVRIQKTKVEELEYLQKAHKISLGEYYSGLIDEVKAEVSIKEKSLTASIQAIKAEMDKLGSAKHDGARKQELQRLLTDTEQDLRQAKLSAAVELRNIDEAQIARLKEITGETETVTEKYKNLFDALNQFKDLKNSEGKQLLSDSEFTRMSSALEQNKRFDLAQERDAEPRQLPGLKKYNDMLKEIMSNTKDLQATNSGTFDAALGGINLMSAALDNLGESLTYYVDQQSEWAKKFGDALADLEGDPDALSKRMELVKNYNKGVDKINADSYKSTLNGISRIVGATEEMFGKETKEAKAVHKLRVALSVAAMAQNALEMASTAKKMFMDVAGGVAKMFQQSGWFGFAGAAAFLALMASLGFGSGGGSNTTIPTDSGTTGTVLGDKEASSQSLANVGKILQDIHAKEYRELVGINQNVATMAAGIQDAVASIFRNNELAIEGTFGKDINRGWNAAVDPFNIGSKIPFVGKITDAVNEFLFGSKKVELKAVGIMTSATKLVDVAAKGVKPQQFQIDHVTKKGGLGGIFGGNKSYDVETRSPLNPETSSIINRIFANAGDSIFAASSVFNNVFDEAINKYILPALKVDLKDLKGEDAAKKLQESISTLLDRAAGAIFTSLRQYQKLGEGMFETVNRIVIDLSVVRDSLDMVRTPLKVFGLDAIAVAEAIVKASGDVQTARKNFEAFFESFFMDVEQQSYNMNRLSGMLQDMGLVLPETRDGWKALTQTMLAGGVATANTAARLLELSSSADEYYKAVEKGQAIEKGITQAGTAAIAKLAEGIDYVYLKFGRLFSLMSVDPSRTWIGFDTTMQEAGKAAGESLQQALASLEKASEGVQKAILDKTNVLYDLITTISINSYQALETAKLSGALNSKDWDKQFAAQRKLEAIRANVKQMEEELYLRQKERIEAEFNRTVEGESAQDKYNRQINSIEKYQSLLQTKYDKELQILTQTVTAISGIQTHVRELLLNDSLSPENKTQMLERARQQYLLTLSAAQGGDVTALGNVNSTLDAYLTKAREYYASSEDYARIFQDATNAALSLDSLMMTTEQKIESNTAKMVAELQKLQASLGVLDGERQTVLEADRKAVFDHFGKVVYSFLQGIQILVDAVVPNNNVDIGASYGNPKTGTGDQSGSVQQNVVSEDIANFDRLMRSQDYIAAASYAIGRGYSKPAIADYVASAYNISQEDTLRWLSANGFAKGGAFTNGVVTKPTMFNMGIMGEKGSEGILPLTNVNGILGVHATRSNDQALVAELRALRQEVATLRAEQREHTGALIYSNYDANNNAAKKVVDVTKETALDAKWATKAVPVIS